MTKYLIENQSTEPVEIGPAEGPSETLAVGFNTVATLDAETFHRLDGTSGVRVTKREPETAHVPAAKPVHAHKRSTKPTTKT